jgi:hypothetical protein
MSRRIFSIEHEDYMTTHTYWSITYRPFSLRFRRHFLLLVCWMRQSSFPPKECSPQSKSKLQLSQGQIARSRPVSRLLISRFGKLSLFFQHTSEDLLP